MLATYTVSNLNDHGGGTLRQAILDANNSPGADLIQFASGLSGDINLSMIDDTTAGPSALLVTSEIAIRGNSEGITINRDTAAAETRLFRVTTTGNLSLESIMLSGGIVRGTGGAAGQSGGIALGGAIYNEGTLLVVASTLYGNSAVGGNAEAGGNGGSGLGGAIYNDGGSVTIRNATLSGNSVLSGTGDSSPSSFGGAVYSRNGSLVVDNSTITNNIATTGRGFYIIGVGAGETASAEIYSSIIAQADLPESGYDFLATIDDGGQKTVAGANNLIRSQNAFPPGDPGDPLLGVLANNGGPTLTHALLAGSPAIDHGSNRQNLLTDQRGSPSIRMAGTATDIGAFEVQAGSGPALPGDYNGNTVVDGPDYVLWRKTFGADVPQFAGADGSGNSQIDAADYDVWRGNFGAKLSAEATASLSTDNMSSIVPAARSNSQAIDSPFNGLVLERPTSANVAIYGVARIDAGMSHEKVFRIDRKLHSVNQKAHDEALLAVVAERFGSLKSFAAAATLTNEREAGAARAESDDSALSMNFVPNQLLLQTPQSAVASIYTA